MKKIILLLSIVVLSFSNTNAQKIDFGITSYYNLHKIKGDGMQYTIQPGFSVGAYSDISVSKKISLQPEISFLQKKNVRNIQKVIKGVYVLFPINLYNIVHTKQYIWDSHYTKTIFCFNFLVLTLYKKTGENMFTCLNSICVFHLWLLAAAAASSRC